MKFLQSKIAWQLLMWLLVIEFPVESLLVYISYRNSKETLEIELTEKLRAIATYQIQNMNEYVHTQLYNINAFASTPEISSLTQDLVAVRDTAALQKLLLNQKTIFEKYQEVFSFHSVILVDNSGKICLSTETKLPEGENLATGSLQNTELYRTYKRTNTILQPDFSDFTYMPRSNRQLTAFVAAPIRNKAQKPIGTLIASINIDKLKKVTQNYAGMGETGEILLISKVENEAIFVLPNRRNTITEAAQRIDMSTNKSEGIKNALAAETGYGLVKDYAGRDVFAHWHYIPALRSGLVIKEDVAEAFAPIQQLRNILLLIVACTLLLFVFAAFNIAKLFTKPIRKLNEVTKKIAAGDLTQKADINATNEIGELAHSFNDMTGRIYTVQNELKEMNANLEFKVAERTEELQTMIEELNQTNEELYTTVEFVEKQKNELTKKNDNIVASITYARRIQAAILPLHEDINKVLKDFFIFYKPRDIVSGDFYWFGELPNNQCLIAAADCTGHGVPGALMSMIGVNLLNEIVYLMDIDSPELILDKMQVEINRILQQSVTGVRDGMDIAICKIDLPQRQVEYAGAMNSVYYIQNNQLHEIKSNRIGIGGNSLRKPQKFDKHIIHLSSPTMLYLFSDGYADQIGGISHRKYMTKNFKSLLLSLHHLYPEMQQENLALTLHEWMAGEPQLDDIMVIGVKL
ncbi:MAG: HAMP domain-containing protein [Thermoflexibacteraceae bacterium]|jgi:serine phosphatase RsbU (regulator of sigma subunit)